MSEKLNGWRAFWDGANLRTRSWQIIPAPNAITMMLPIGMALDGEIHAGRGGWSTVQSLCKSGDMTDPRWDQVTYSIFDYPTTELLPIEQRLNIARKLAYGRRVDFVEHTVISDTHEMWMKFAEIIREGGEGLVIKRPASYYEFERSSDWLKVKMAGVS